MLILKQDNYLFVRISKDYYRMDKDKVTVVEPTDTAIGISTNKVKIKVDEVTTNGYKVDEWTEDKLKFISAIVENNGTFLVKCRVGFNNTLFYVGIIKELI